MACIRLRGCRAFVGAIIGAGAVCIAAPGLATPDAQHPTVVELFQSQGCSSCPPANANVIALSRRPDVLTLSFGVTYWDNLGWKDTFASPQYTGRQWAYARAFRRANVFTPEVVVNGRADGVGQDPRELDSLVRRGARTADAVEIRIAGGSVEVGAGSAPHSAQVWLVRYDPRVLEVPIQRGENGGRTLPHKNVVRELVKLGDWAGRPQSYRAPPPRQSGLSEAVLLQVGPGGPILAAARG
jgi:hypothetical protein